MLLVHTVCQIDIYYISYHDIIWYFLNSHKPIRWRQLAKMQASRKKRSQEATPSWQAGGRKKRSQLRIPYRGIYLLKAED